MQKYSTICVGHHFTQTNTINVNKTFCAQESITFVRNLYR